MMLADRRHGARLRPLLPLLGMERVTDLVADAELVESLAEYAVAMHVDLLAVRRGDEPIALLGEEACDATMIRAAIVRLHVAADAPRMIGEPPAGGVER